MRQRKHRVGYQKMLSVTGDDGQPFHAGRGEAGRRRSKGQCAVAPTLGRMGCGPEVGGSTVTRRTKGLRLFRQSRGGGRYSARQPDEEAPGPRRCNCA